MHLKSKDVIALQKIYKEKYASYGYSPKSLLWDKGKQNIRFDILTSFYNCDGKSVLDIGCGFGDLNKTLRMKCQKYNYFGVDLVEELINEGRKIYNSEQVKFQNVDFLADSFIDTFDYAIASGTFNIKLDQTDNYEFIKMVMDKAWKITRDGFAFDFLSDKVDYHDEHSFYSSPEKILAMAYKYSRNVILRNDYMPFEFSLFVFRDGSFEKEDTLFTRYKREKMLQDKGLKSTKE